MRKFYPLLGLLIVAGMLFGSACVARADNIFLPTILTGGTPTPAAIVPTGATSTPASPVEPTSAPPVEPTEVGPVTPLPTVVPVTPLPTPVPDNPTATSTATQVAPPTSAPTATSTPELIPPHGPDYFFGFEFGKEGWHTSEAGNGKRAEVSVVTAPVRSGLAALAIDTELRGNDVDVFRHTEAKVYFASSDMAGQRSQIWIYIPASVLEGDDNEGEPGYLEFLHYVVSEGHSNQYDPRTRVDATMVNQWIMLDLTVGVVEQNGHIDSGFDPEKIIGGGVRFEAYGDFDFSGIVAYVDDVKFGYSE